MIRGLRHVTVVVVGVSRKQDFLGGFTSDIDENVTDGRCGARRDPTEQTHDTL
jgi:hypothetical protein